jgi:hypothetical protein
MAVEHRFCRLALVIVMGEVPVPVAEIYHPVEGGEMEIRFLFSNSGTHIDCI